MSRYSALVSVDNTSTLISPTMSSIDLDLLSLERPSSRASSSSSSTSGIYIPVHRRKLSNISSSASSVSSVPPSPASSMSSFACADVPIYSPADLIMMSHSPLARLADEERSHMRVVAPEIYLSRKQRSRLERHGKQRSADNKSLREEREGRRSDGANSWRRS